MLKNWTEVEINKLKDLYLKLTKLDLMLEFPDRSWSSIKSKSQKLGLIKREKIKINDNIFEIPNNINSYYAGFIAADGCVNDSGSLSFELASKDLHLLQKFNLFSSSNYQIRQTQRTLNNKIFDISVLKITSKKICLDLKSNFAIKPRKTLNCEFPKTLTRHQKISYIIGNLDGDGWISNSKTQNGYKFSISWLGDYDFLDKIRNLFFRLGWLDNEEKYINRKTRFSKLFVLSFSCQTGRKIYNNLKSYIKIYKLPVLSRKWFNKNLKL